MAANWILFAPAMRFNEILNILKISGGVMVEVVVVVDVVVMVVGWW